MRSTPARSSVTRRASCSSALPASSTIGTSTSATSLRSGAADASSAPTSSITSPPPTVATPDLKNLILDPYFCDIIGKSQAHWRYAVQTAIEYGVAVPAFSAALSYYDSYRAERLPANLLQAQRDYFGAHTYERVDKPAGRIFSYGMVRRGEVKREGSPRQPDVQNSAARCVLSPCQKLVENFAQISKTPLTTFADGVF